MKLHLSTVIALLIDKLKNYQLNIHQIFIDKENDLLIEIMELFYLEGTLFDSKYIRQYSLRTIRR